MANGEEPVVFRGPIGFRRLYNGIRDMFSSGAGGPIVTPNTSGTTLAPVVARAKADYQNDKAWKSRMQLSSEKMMMWENNFRALVENRLREQFHPTTYSRMCLSIHTSTNELRRVVRELAILYEQPAKRKLLAKSSVQTEGSDGASGSLTDQAKATEQAADDAPTLATGDAEVDALADLLELSDAVADAEDSPFDRAMRAKDWDIVLDTVDRLTLFHPVVWVRPIVTGARDAEGQIDTSTTSLSYAIYTPANAAGVPSDEDPSKLAAWWYESEEIGRDGRLARVFYFYTSDGVEKYNANWERMEVAPNKLKRLPVATFRRDFPLNGAHCDGIGDDLFEGTLELCCLKTIQNARARDAGFKQIAVQGDPKNIPADQVMGGPDPIYLGPDSTVEVLDLQPALDQFTALINARRADLADRYGVKDFGADHVPQSGYAKRLEKDKVLKESRRARKFFAEGERDLYHLLAVTLDAYPIANIGKLDASAELETDFAEPQFDMEPKEQAAIDSADIKLSKVSVLDILRRDNPDLSDAELVKLAVRNRRINAVLLGAGELKLTDMLAESFAGGGGKQPGDGPPADEGGGEQ